MNRPRILLPCLALALLALPASGQEPSSCSPSATDANKILVQRYIGEVLAGGRLDLLPDLVSADFVDRTPGAPAGSIGPEVIRESQARARELFQDIHYTIDDLIAEGDRVVARYTVKAVRKAGDGAEGGKPIRVTGVTLFQIADGKIRETWIVNDQIELFRQLGYTLTPPKPEPQPKPQPPAPPEPAPAGPALGRRARRRPISRDTGPALPRRGDVLHAGVTSPAPAHLHEHRAISRNAGSALPRRGDVSRAGASPETLFHLPGRWLSAVAPGRRPPRWRDVSHAGVSLRTSSHLPQRWLSVAAPRRRLPRWRISRDVVPSSGTLARRCSARARLAAPAHRPGLRLISGEILL